MPALVRSTSIRYTPTKCFLYAVSMQNISDWLLSLHFVCLLCSCFSFSTFSRTHCEQMLGLIDMQCFAILSSYCLNLIRFCHLCGDYSYLHTDACIIAKRRKQRPVGCFLESLLQNKLLIGFYRFFSASRNSS